MKEEREQVLTEVKDSEYKILCSLKLSENSAATQNNDRDDESATRHSNQTMNSASSDAVQLDILFFLKEMKEDNNNSRGNS